MKDNQTNKLYEFSAFLLDVKKRRLMRGDELVPLTPKEFEVLLLLVENAGKVVEKDELLDAVWKDTFVEEGTLTRNISWLRRKLADGGNAKVIETLPKRGYRFLPEIIKRFETEIAVAGQFPEQSALVVETHTIQEIQIEERIEILPSSNDNEIIFADGKFHETPKIKRLPAAPAKLQISALWIVPLLAICAALTFFTYRGYVVKNQSNVILAARVAPFSGLPGRENSPSFSPDGKQLVFAWDGGIEGANSDIYVKLIGAGEPVRLTNTETEEINPTFSPDGKYIAYDAQNSGSSIYVVSVNGGAARNLTDDGKNNSLPAWSVDGNSIFFLSNRSGSDQIWKMSANGGEAVQITEQGTFEMFAAPDEKTIIYSKSGGKSGLWSVKTDGGDEKPLPELAGTGAWRSWSVVPNKIYYTAFDAQIPLPIKFYDFKTEQIREVAVVNKIPLHYYANLTVSADGRKLLYARQDQTNASIMLAEMSE